MDGSLIKVCSQQYSTHLRVALPTVGTNVCLNMLRLLMLGYVVEQGLLVSKTFIAGVTLVGLVRLMTPRVRLQVGQLGEGLGATWMCKSEQKVLIVSC